MSATGRKVQSGCEIKFRVEYCVDDDTRGYYRIINGNGDTLKLDPVENREDIITFFKNLRKK